MEEDIEIIQNIIFNKNGDQMNYIDINNGTHDNECETFITAIEHLIQAYKELEEENMQLESIKDEAIRKYNFESIPKSKVKEEIEELNKKEQELQNSISDEEREEYSDASISFELMDIEIRRSVLQELLGEE